MITNLIVRRAKDISNPNEIANFNSRYSIACANIAAVSWELPNSSRREFGEILLKKVIKKLQPDCSAIQIMVEISPEQPNSAIVKYKKTWGLLQDWGVQISNIDDKLSFEKKGLSGFILSGTGVVSMDKENVITPLINSQEKVFFSIGKSGFRKTSQYSNPNDWMRYIWDEGGIVFMLLGYFDEPSCEVVALANERDFISISIE